MTDDLRTRIAAAILRTKVGRCELHSYEADILADAVIRELGLTRELHIVNDRAQPRHRYVTDWTPE